MNKDKILLLLLLLVVSVSVLLSLKTYFVKEGIMEGFYPSYSTDFNSDIQGSKCRCKNGALGDVALYLDADACVCNPSVKSRDRPELTPGELGQQYRNKHPLYDLNCHLSSEFDAHVDITQPYKPNIEDSQPMKFKTYKKQAYAHCNSTLNDANTYEQQYKRSVTSQTKQLQDKPYLYTTYEDDAYFKDWATQ